MTTTATTVDITSAIVGALHARHPSNEWACFGEFTIHPGLGAGRVDFYAISAWPSDGFSAVAYEIKASRSDFLHELDQPGKRAAAWDFSNQAWFATPPGVVRDGEVPEGWGHLVMSDSGRLTRKVAAQQRVVAEWPQDVVAAIARAAAKVANGGYKPPALWKAMGRDLTCEQLVALAEEVGSHEIRAQRSALRADVRSADEVEQLKELQRTVATLCGVRAMTPHGFRAWHESALGEALGLLTEPIAGLKAQLDYIQRIAEKCAGGGGQ